VRGEKRRNCVSPPTVPQRLFPSGPAWEWPGVPSSMPNREGADVTTATGSREWPELIWQEQTGLSAAELVVEWTCHSTVPRQDNPSTGGLMGATESQPARPQGETVLSAAASPSRR
jgi:hypothetical protein